MAESLLKQNVWLRDATQRADALRLAAASSSAVEGIIKPFTRAATVIKTASRKPAGYAATHG